MLRFTKETDYGLVLLKFLLERPEGTVRSARELAAATTLPLPMVAGLLKRLAKQGILLSFRGPRGGYALRCDSITVASAIEALQGPISLTTCNGAGIGDCLMSGGCPIVSYTREITVTIRNSLERLDLKTLFEISGPTPPDGPESENPEEEPR
jgi:Rrf2 family protein